MNADVYERVILLMCMSTDLAIGVAIWMAQITAKLENNNIRRRRSPF